MATATAVKPTRGKPAIRRKSPAAASVIPLDDDATPPQADFREFDVNKAA
jgi:hypothetical protein